MITALISAILIFAPTATDSDWHHCKYEDGSGQHRCIWDGKHDGNGEGDSVKIIKGGTDAATYTIISHRKAKSLLGANH